MAVSKPTGDSPKAKAAETSQGQTSTPGEDNLKNNKNTLGNSYDPLKEAQEIREQLSSEKRRLAFFFGAGTSISIGLPGINELTNKVEDGLSEDDKKTFQTIKAFIGANANVEQVLDHIRLCREYIGNSEDREISGIKGSIAARALEEKICNGICQSVRSRNVKGHTPHSIFAQWLRALYSSRENPVEIFTLNYDVIFEIAMEEYGIPYFDGFVGTVSPFFNAESVESDYTGKADLDRPPRSWTRLWKLHGSINWCNVRNESGTLSKITRMSGEEPMTNGELVIFPSREKYAQSRKLPFWAYQDRLRRFLSSGESSVIMLGYSFRDEHLNEILFQGLRSNPRLSVTAFIHGNLSEELIRYGNVYRNLSIYGPDKACVAGLDGSWSELTAEQQKSEKLPFWDNESSRFLLGDFRAFTLFLEQYIGIFRSSESPLSRKFSEDQE